MSRNSGLGEPIADAGQIMDLAWGFRRPRVLLTAHELGLFTVLGDEAMTSAQVAERLGSDPRATDRLMNALIGLGLLTKAEGRFSNAPAAAKHLVRGRPGFLAGLDHAAGLWESWSALTAAVKAGRPVASTPLARRDAAFFEAFIAAMHARAAGQAEELAELIDLTGVSRVLDVGGGSGVFAMAMAKARPGLTAVVFDLPQVTPLTRQYLAAEGLSDRITVVNGDYNADELGSGFDLVLLSAILHANSPDQNRALLAKCAAALKPGGRVAVSDFIMSEDRTSPAFGAMFSLNMLVATEQGDTYTASEITAWLEEAGFSGVRFIETSFGADLAVAIKG